MAGTRPPVGSILRRAVAAARAGALLFALAACTTSVTASPPAVPPSGAVASGIAPARIDPCSLVTAGEFTTAMHAAVRVSPAGLNTAGTVDLCPFAGADKTAADGTVITDGGFVGLATSVAPLTTFVATYGLPLGPDCTVAGITGLGDAAYAQRCPEYPHTGDVVAWRGGLTLQVEVSGAQLTQDAAVAGATDLMRRALARLP